jgi:hypothetical protein
VKSTGVNNGSGQIQNAKALAAASKDMKNKAPPAGKKDKSLQPSAE